MHSKLHLKYINNKFPSEITWTEYHLREAAAHDAPLRACAVVPGTNGAGAGGGTQVLQERYGMIGMYNQPDQALAMFIPCLYRGW